MKLSFSEILNSTLILFSVIDILGSTPVIIGLRQKAGHINSGKATIVALIIMVSFLFLGELLLKMFGLDLPSFAIAGSIVMFLIAMEMILGVQLFKDAEPNTVSIVPIAFPLIAGAGTLTTLLAIRAEYAAINVIVGIVLNMILVYIVLKNTKWIERIIGKNGIDVLRRVFGIVLLTIAVKLFKTNLLI